MKYKNYRARIEYSEEDETFVGRVLGIRDIIGFHGNSVAEMRREFKESVDQYLEHCKKIGKEPNREFSGKFVIRLSAEQHRALAVEAEQKGASLNELVQKKLFGTKAA